MKRELLLLRHGKSDWNTTTDDFCRPLKARGIRGAKRIGVWLLQNNLIPDHFITSPAERALATAQKTCSAMEQAADNIIKDQRAYLADIDNLLQVLAECPHNARRILLVGHNPGLEDLLLLLACERVTPTENGKLLTTATLAHLEVSCQWNALEVGCAKVLSIIRPDTLSE